MTRRKMIMRTIDCPCCREEVEVPAISKADERIAGKVCPHCGIVINVNAYLVPLAPTQEFLEIHAWSYRWELGMPVRAEFKYPKDLGLPHIPKVLDCGAESE